MVLRKESPRRWRPKATKRKPTKKTTTIRPTGQVPRTRQRQIKTRTTTQGKEKAKGNRPKLTSILKTSASASSPCRSRRATTSALTPARKACSYSWKAPAIFSILTGPPVRPCTSSTSRRARRTRFVDGITCVRPLVQRREDALPKQDEDVRFQPRNPARSLRSRARADH